MCLAFDPARVDPLNARRVPHVFYAYLHPTILRWCTTYSLHTLHRDEVFHCRKHIKLEWPTLPPLIAMASSSSSSSPPLPPSFDPAIYLHSSNDPEPFLPQPNSNSDDLEALHVRDNELAVAKNHGRIVVQHRSWEFLRGLRSDDIFNPGPSDHCLELACSTK